MTVLAAREQFAAADVAGEEVAGCGDFGRVREIEPAAVEDARAFGGEHVLVDESPARDAEHAGLGVVDDMAWQRLGLHAGSF